MYLSNFKIDKEVTKCQAIEEETIKIAKKKDQGHETQHQTMDKEDQQVVLEKEDHKQVVVLEKDQQQNLTMKELTQQGKVIQDQKQEKGRKINFQKSIQN